MISDSRLASVYTDFQGLAALRAKAAKNNPEATVETVRQFEALFVQMMLKAMREASPGGGIFDSNQVGFYSELYDRQLALSLVKGRGLGITELLTSQLRGQDGRPMAASDPSRDGSSPFPGLPAPVGPAAPDTDDVSLATRASVKNVTALTVAGHMTGNGNQDWRPRNPGEFIQDLWPHAERGAAALGVSPEVLVAQAALETGWGQKVIRHADGDSSFNLFGIKADAGWRGSRVTVPTLEYEDGVAVKRRAAFRSYDSLGEAVSDYVDFLRGNPRYQQALKQAANPETYLRGLKDAGYATDPDYVEKIRTIMNQQSFSRDAVGLKIAQQDPLT
jgi:flagellar protein FlgJ